MNKEKCEYYAGFLLAKARGERVEFKDQNDRLWSDWLGDTCNSRGDYLELRIKPEPLVYWMNKHPSWDTPIPYTSEANAHTAARNSTFKNNYTYIAKRFVEDA